MRLEKSLRINASLQQTAMPAETVRLARRFAAPPSKVFDAWLDPTLAGRWLFATAWRPMTQVSIAARAGGTFHFADDSGFRRSGRYLEIVPQQRLVFSLYERTRRSSTVRVEFTPHRYGCLLSLAHTGVPSDHADYAQARWEGMLYGLELLLDSHSTRSPS